MPPIFFVIMTTHQSSNDPQRSPGAPAWAAYVLALLIGCLGMPVSPVAAAGSESERQVLRVGAQRPIKTIAQASRLARNGARIEVDAGTYAGDVAVWTQDGLSLRAVGGRVVLLAAGASAEGKAIWVVRAQGMQVEGFDFRGAAVPGSNGAGIRFERGSLLVRDCSFTNNETGLLTSNDPEAVLEVENSEFAYNQRPDGHNHNLYVGQIARVTVTGSYFHHAHIGHLLKSRAAVSHILYNRLTDEPGGRASYELEFPNGGVAVVVGNLIEQGPQTENPAIISYGAEGYKWPTNALSLVHNTLVDHLPAGGVPLRVWPGAVTVRVYNNLLVGPGAIEASGTGEARSNFKATDADFVNAPGLDYRLKADSHLVGQAAEADASATADRLLLPTREYVHPQSTRALGGRVGNPGAFQGTVRKSP